LVPKNTSNKNINNLEEDNGRENLFLINTLFVKIKHISHLRIVRKDGDARSPATCFYLDW
jgi:hypothetical protein